MEDLLVLAWLHNFDNRVVCWCRSDPTVAGEERSVQSLRESHINRVVRGECCAQIPNTRKEKVMGIAKQGEGAKIVERFLPPVLGQFLVSNKAAQDLGYFDV